MASSIHRLRYFALKARDALATALQSPEVDQLSTSMLLRRVWKDVTQERMTTLKIMKGEEMEPTFAAAGESLLVRKIPFPYPQKLFVGDVVLFKDPLDSSVERVRRIAAMPGDEMVSIDENDKPFEIEQGACWVISDNDVIKPKDAADSRSFGPLSMRNILGRVLYAMRSSSDHGQLMNSYEALREDYSILKVELNLDELAENLKQL